MSKEKELLKPKSLNLIFNNNPLKNATEIKSPVNDNFNKLFEDNLPELERKLGAYCPKHLEDIIVRVS